MIYPLEKSRFIVTGTSIGESGALLLVQDRDLDPFETLSKEIHRVDLIAGEGTVILRAPDGTFIQDIDWIAANREE